jgi:uncharacterized repeat protein (TIGR04052 family)
MTLRFFTRALAIAVLLLTVSAVFAQDSGGNDGHGGMMMSGLPGVGPDVTIRFAAMVGNSPAACGMIYEGVGAAGSPISLNDFRFYVSNVRLITAMGEEVPVELTQDGRWQYADVALLDFEDGTGMCREAGTPDMNDKVVGTVPPGEYTGIAFDLGVPFELNHLDTTTAPAPLNLPAMWWNWRIGYKFVRIDMQTPRSQTPAWFIHLGSTGCPSPDSSTPPTDVCSNPNLATVRLDGFNPTRTFVIADAAALLSGVNLDESVPMPPGCMSGTEDPDCAALFPAFGLDLESGMNNQAGVQQFFRVG